VPDLDESLHQILRADGVKSAALVDVATGMVVRAAGELDAGVRAAAASAADETRLACAALAGDQAGGHLEEILLTTSSRFHLVRILAWRQGEGLLLFADVSRAHTNTSLAAWQLGQAASAILA
jgi:hypothetical protein